MWGMHVCVDGCEIVSPTISLQQLPLLLLTYYSYSRRQQLALLVLLASIITISTVAVSSSLRTELLGSSLKPAYGSDNSRICSSSKITTFSGSCSTSTGDGVCALRAIFQVSTGY